MHALGLEFGSAAQLSKRPGSVWNCLWGNALKRSPGIIRKSRVSYPVPGFLSSATWPSLPKKHYNGLKQTKPNHNQYKVDYLPSLAIKLYLMKAKHRTKTTQCWISCKSFTCNYRHKHPKSTAKTKKI